MQFIISQITVSNKFYVFVYLDWGFKKEREGKIHFYFLNYEQCKIFFLNKLSVFEVLYDNLSCC